MNGFETIPNDPVNGSAATDHSGSCKASTTLMPRLGTMKPLTAWSPGFSRSKPFEPPKGGTPNQPGFMESGSAGRRSASHTSVRRFWQKPGNDDDQPGHDESENAPKQPTAHAGQEITLGPR